MLLHFGEALDGASWHGPNDAWNEAWLGPRGVLERLELDVGRARPALGRMARAAAAVPALDAHAGSQEELADRDPIGVALHLLDLYDGMRSWKVLPAGQVSRLAFTLGQAAPPGLPDRLFDLLQETPPSGLEKVVLDEPLEDMPPVWQEVWQWVGRGGREGLLDAPRRGGPRARRRAGRKRPVLELSAPDALQAAEALADLLAEPSAPETVVVGGDALLEAALARRGLPSLGIRGGPMAACELVMAALELALEPVDPRQAASFLSVAPAPWGRDLGLALLRTLHQSPAVHSPSWRALLEGHAAAGGAQAARRADRWFRPCFSRAATAAGSPLDCGTMGARLADLKLTLDEALAAPARHRAAASEAAQAEARGLAALAATLDTASALLRASGRRQLSEVAMRRLLAAAIAEQPGVRRTPAQVGLVHVARPGAVLAPAERIVWWNATSEAVPPSRLPRLDAETRLALERAGGALPSPAAEAARDARGWARLVDMAQGSMVFVAPRRDARGQEVGRHPAIDIFGAERMPARAPAAADGPLATDQPRAPLLTVQVGGPVRRRPREDGKPADESFSSLEKLLGCSLHWALSNVAWLEQEAVPELKTDARLEGIVAHEVLRQAAEPKHHAVPLSQIAAQVVGALAPAMKLPRHAVRHRAFVLRLERGLGELLGLVRGGGRRRLGSEMKLFGAVAGRPLKGTIDLALDDPPLVVDLKTGRTTALREELHQGAPLQLAIYGRLLAEALGRPVSASYFDLARSCFIPVGGAVVAPAALAETWQAFEEACARAFKDLDSGRLCAAGNEGDQVRARRRGRTETAGVTAGTLTVPAPCKHCPYPFACGQR